MSEPADIAALTQRFNQAVRAFVPPAPARHAQLMPMKDGISELRLKGASLRLIRELFATVGVAVGTDTIARFLAEVNGESQPLGNSKRPSRARNPRRNTIRVQPDCVLAATVPTIANSLQAPAPNLVTAVDAETIWAITRSGVSKIEARLSYVHDKGLLYLAEVLKVQVPELFPIPPPGNRIYDFIEKLETTRF